MGIFVRFDLKLTSEKKPRRLPLLNLKSKPEFILKTEPVRAKVYRDWSITAISGCPLYALVYMIGLPCARCGSNRAATFARLKLPFLQFVEAAPMLA